MQEELADVLAHWDYPRALSLFAKYGDNAFLLDICREGESPYTREILREQLEALQEKKSDPEPIIRRVYASRPDVQQVVVRRQQAYRQRDWYHAQLGTETDPLRRMLYAHRVLALEEELRDCWQALSHFEQHGALPEDPPEVEIDLEQSVYALIQLYNTCLRYVHKYEGKPDKAAEVAQRKALLTKIEAL
jgi:hypothetical protein